jgi:multicomponent K+:H+ antiporter subunit E
MIRRLLPYPAVALALAAIWLLLNESLGAGALLLAAVVALAGGWLLVPLGLARARPAAPRLRRIVAGLRLLRVVTVEIVRSNNAVARLILGLGGQRRTSGFVRIPLDMRSPYGLATLACIITATPGTIWVEYDSADNTMLLHVLDLVDEAQWLRIIKYRYERPLMEIFE